MIKINLLRNRVGETTQIAPSGGIATSSVSPIAGANEEARQAIVKLLLIFLATGGLMIYESQNLRSLQTQVANLTAQVSTLDTQYQSKQKEVEAIKDIEAQSKELDDKLKVLKLLSTLRLREVKTLDFIQSSVPEKVWLKGLTYEAEKERSEHGMFRFTGNSVSTEDLTEFVKRLEESSYLYEVIVVKNQELAPPTAGGGAAKSVVRDFQFNAQVEVKP